MTVQSLHVLRKLKKAQISEDGMVFIDYEEPAAITVCERDAPNANQKLENYKQSLESVLLYLSKEGLIDVSGNKNDTVEVTHAGWHYWQTMLTRLGNFLIASIAVPIVVASITSIITLWITSWPKR